MKYIIFIFSLFLLASCDDAQMVTEVKKDIEIPVWVYDTDCDSTTLVHYLKGEHISYVFNTQCEPIKIVEETNSYPSNMLLLFLLGIALGIVLGLLLGASKV